MALTPDQIKNLPSGENVFSVLFRKNLTANKNAGAAPKVGYQGSTELPSVTLTRKKLGKSIPKVEGEEPINTPRVKNYVEKPPWQKLGIYEANDIYSTLKDMYRQYDLGKVVHPGLAMGALFSPALTASAIPFLFQGENFRKKLKELSAKYQPETVADIMTGLPQRTALQRGLNVLTSIGQTTAKAWKADDYIRFKALDATLTTEEKKQLGWSGKYDESQVQNYLPSDESKKPLIWEAMKRPQYRQALDSFGNMSVKDVAGEYWSGIVSALKDEKQEVNAKEGTTQNVMQTVASKTQIHKNPVVNTLMELNLDPTVVALPFSMGAKGAIQAAAKSGKLRLSKEVLTSLTKSDTLGEFALRIGAKKSWKEAATAVKSLADTPVFRKLADEGGFVNFGKKAETVVGTPVQKLIQGIKGAKSLSNKQEQLYTQARAIKVAKGQKVAGQIPGEAGFKATLATQEGELPRVQFESVRPKLEQTEVDDLFNQIENTTSLDFYDKLNTKVGLSKLLGETGGKMPTKSELVLLENVFGSDLAKAIKTQRGTIEKIKENLVEVANVPRALMASLDMSAPFRQGLLLTVKHPKKATSAFKQMFKSFAGEKHLLALDEAIKAKSTYKLMKENKLSFTQYGKQVLGTREEVFMSNIAERIPGLGRLVKASERAYVSYLNKMRADVFDDLAKKLLSSGYKKSDKVFKDLAKFVNTSTGRGSLGRLESASVELNGLFFAPRLIASRLQALNPIYYAKLSKPIRIEAAKTLLTTASTGLTILGLLKASGSNIETDPKSADFGKIKIGETRIDIWGGFQQYAVLASRLIANQTKTTRTGEVKNLGEGYKPETRWSLGLKFLENKFAPIPGLIRDVARGKNAVGEEATPKDLAFNNLVPLYVQDMIEANKTLGAKSVLIAGVPGFFGVGTQTYGNISSGGGFKL